MHLSVKASDADMTDTLVLERIDANLTRLRMPCMKEILERVIASCERKGQSYLTFLDELLEEEVARKEQRRVETALKISGLPFIKSIDEFDFAFHPKLDRQKVMSLFDLTFIRQKGNVIFLDPPGMGENTSGRLSGIKGLSGRAQYLFYHDGRPDRKTQKGSRGRPYGQATQLL
jgi:hypothetical protein